MVLSAYSLDWEPLPPRLPLWMRVYGWVLSRAEFVHRALRDLYRTRIGFVLVWANIVLWSLYLLAGVLPC